MENERFLERKFPHYGALITISHADSVDREFRLIQLVLGCTEQNA